MWLWQPNVPELYKPFLRICGIICVAHLVALFSLLVVYRGYHGSLTIDLSRQLPADAQVVLLPLYKTVPVAAQQGVQATPSSGASKQHTKEKPRAVAKKTSVHKTGLARVASIKKRQIKNNIKQQKKRATPRAAKLPTPAKQEQSIQHLAPVVPSAATMQAMQDHVGPVYIGSLELDALVAQQALKTEIEDIWQAPVGVKSGLSCQVKVRVDWQGALCDVAVLQSSGVLIYDMSVQETLHAMKFPKITWGKDITITFS